MSLKGYVWHTSASDKTGAALANLLGFSADKKTPNFGDFDIVVGWGCKPGNKYSREVLDEMIAGGQIRVINHPEAVTANKNRLSSLKAMAKAGVRTPAFVEKMADMNRQAFFTEALRQAQQGTMPFPIIGMDKFNHQFHFCFTAEDVQALYDSAYAEEVDYFRAYIPGTEYRIHVFRDMCVAAQVKVLSQDPVKATADFFVNKAKKEAQKSGQVLAASDNDLTLLSTLFAREMVKAPSHVLKSTGKGWEFQDVGLDKIGDDVLGTAVKAMDAVGLDLGAVTVTMSAAGPVANSISTSPALEAVHLEAYKQAILEFAKAGAAMKVRRLVKAEATAQPVTEQDLRSQIVARVSALPKEKLQKLLQEMS